MNPSDFLQPRYPRCAPRDCLRLLSSGLLALSVCTTASAQIAPGTTTPNPPPPAVAKDDVVALEVFTVNVSQDTGYTSERGLSGGRLVTDLSDIASNVAVLTKEFLNDINGTDLAGFADYALNVQVDLEDGNNADVFTASTEGLGRDNTNVRIRGLGGSKTLDFLDFDWNNDTYNVGRIDLSLGSNAILFGNGGPGGNINVTRDRAHLSRPTKRISVQTDNKGSLRSTFDTNIVLMKDRAALRLEGLHQERTGRRNFDFNDRQGLYGNLAIRPAKNTAINVSLERGQNKVQGDRITGPSDNLSAWLAAGKPTAPAGDPTANALFPGLTIAPTRTTAGLAETNNFSFGGAYTVPTERTNTRLATNAYQAPVVFTTTPDTTSARYQPSFDPRGAAFGTSRGWGSEGADRIGTLFLEQDGIVNPIDTAMAGPDSFRTQHFGDFRVNLEQRLTRDLFVSAFYGRNHTNRFGQTMNRVDQSFALYGEPNRQFPDFLGKMYIQSRWQNDYETNRREAGGVTLAYRINFAGTEHNVSAYFQKDTHRQTRTNAKQWLAAVRRDPVTNAVLEQQPLFLRNYFAVGDPRAHARLNVPKAPFQDANGQSWSAAWIPDTLSPTQLTAGNTPFIGRNLNRSYYTLHGQSYFFQRRLVTSYGYRQDRSQLKRDLYTIDSVSLRPVLATTETLAPFKPDSLTAGVVYYLTPDLSLSGGYASNVGNNQENYIIPPAGQVAPVQPAPDKSTSRDVSVRWRVFSDKLHLNFTHFQAERIGGYQTATIAFWNSVVGSGARGADPLAPTSTNSVRTTFLGQASATNTTIVGNYAIYRPMGPILDSLRAAGKIDADRYASLTNALSPPSSTTVNANSAPDGSNGYEFRAHTSLGNLTIVANYSYTRRDKTGHAAKELAFFDEMIGLVNSLDNNTALPAVHATHDFSRVTTPSTVKARYLEVLRNAQLNLEALANQREEEFGNRPHHTNLALCYSFKEGALRGFALRSRITWNSKTHSQNLVLPSADGKSLVQTPIYGDAYWDGGLGLSYRRKLNSRWFDSIVLDLDVDSIFNGELRAIPLKFIRATDNIPGLGSYEVLARQSNGELIPNAYKYLEPRSYRFRVTLDF